MSEIAEKTLITHVAPLERICCLAPREQALTPDRHQIQMQLQFLRLGVTWLPPALAMAELERLLKGYEADHYRLLENVLETAYRHYLESCGPLNREETHVPSPRHNEAHLCVRFMSTRYELAAELCSRYDLKFGDMRCTDDQTLAFTAYNQVVATIKANMEFAEVIMMQREEKDDF
ncbi:TPA: hypothetical protein ACIBH9_003329 [Salmonella enterica subsp. diarizonae serovar 61:l,v:z35]